MGSTLRAQPFMKLSNIQKERERNRLSYHKHKHKHETRVRSPEARRIWDKKYYADNTEKCKARRKTNYLIETGQLIRLPCRVCGYEYSEAHHEDYSHPEIVDWLCVKHHSERHIQLNQENRA